MSAARLVPRFLACEAERVGFVRVDSSAPCGVFEAVYDDNVAKLEAAVEAARILRTCVLCAFEPRRLAPYKLCICMNCRVANTFDHAVAAITVTT